jgi:hypothetical protein
VNIYFLSSLIGFEAPGRQAKTVAGSGVLLCAVIHQSNVNFTPLDIQGGSPGGLT